jgi:hypothetical protein
MFTRQILLSHSSNSDLNIPNGFDRFNFDDYIVYYHHLNAIYSYQSDSFECLIVGVVVHPDLAEFNLKDLFSDEILNPTFLQINKILERVCGRYYLLYKGDDGVFVRSDATSLAQINYCKMKQIIATDINLLKYSGVAVSINSEAEGFYKEVFPRKGNGNAWIGTGTIYNEICKALPNHTLSLSNYEVTRFWPWRDFNYIDFNIAVSEITNELKLTLKAFSRLAPLSIAVTAGNDSRVMAAASKDVSESCYYFIDKLSSMNDSHPDLVVGARVCEVLNVYFNKHDNFESISNIPLEFKNSFSGSVFYSLPKRLPEVYNYSVKLSGHINICGVGEFGRSVYGPSKFKVEPNYLCYKYQCANSTYANKVTTSWLNELKHHPYASQYPINTLFYIEQKLGNWGAVGNAESDLAFEEVNPFASHYLISKMIMLNSRYTRYTNNKLFLRLVSNMASELDSIPINPKHSFSSKLKTALKSSFIFSIVDIAKYHLINNLGKKVL